MTGVTRATALLAAFALIGSACATKVAPPSVSAGEPAAQPIVLEDVPRHVDTVMHDLQAHLLKPVRDVMRAAPVSPKALASDGSYTRWLTMVTESLVTNDPLPKDLAQLSERAYRDLAHIAGLPTRRDAAALDLSLMARRLHVYFEKQSVDARKTAAAYFESAFSIPG
jgi:hypothetical protein